MKHVLTFLKNKSVIGGMVMVVFYQIAFITIFMSGYSAIPKNMDELTVAIVNDDAKAGKEIAQGLQKQLPFHIETDSTLEQAKEDLDNRDIHMVVHIPKDFSQQLSNPDEKAKIDFLVNQSNPAMVSSTMQSVISQMTSSLNEQFAISTAQGMFQSMNVPEDQAKQMAASIPSKLEANTIYSNAVPAGMHNQMAPFFLTMVSYVGAMIFSMMLVGAMTALKNKIGVWKAFFAAHGVSILVALIAPLIGLGIYFMVQGGYGGEVFAKVWLNQALEMFTAIEFMSIFSLLLKDKAIFVNLTLMLIQTISSGAVMTQDMMPGFFRVMSHVSIMFYSVQSDFSLMFGGGKIGEHLLGLGIYALACFVICALAHKFVSPNSGKDSSGTATHAA